MLFQAVFKVTSSSNLSKSEGFNVFVVKISSYLNEMTCLYQNLSQTLYIPERNRQGTLVGVIGILSGSISGPGIPFKTTSGSSRGMGVD